MEVATPTTEASLSAINETLRRISMTLGRMAARQDQMLVDSKKMTAALAPIVATTPMSAPGRVLEQQKTKPSSFSLFSAGPAASGGRNREGSAMGSFDDTIAVGCVLYAGNFPFVPQDKCWILARTYPVKLSIVPIGGIHIFIGEI
jgi:hypothetical protein